MSNFSLAQKDSLLFVIKNDNLNDTSKLNAYRSLSLELLFSNNIDSALIVVTDALDFAVKNRLKQWEGRLLHLRAYIKSEISQNNQSAIIDLVGAMKIFEAINDQEHLKDVYIELGIANYYLKNYVQSINDYKNAEVLAIQLNNQKDLALIYSNLGPVYQKIQNYKKAIEICEKAEILYKELDDELNYSKAIFNKINNYDLLYRDSSQLVYSNIEEYEKLIKVFEKYNEESSLIVVYSNLGRDYQTINDFKNSIKFLNKGEELAIKINDFESLEDIYLHFSVTYELKEDNVNALHYSKKYIKVHDSLYKINQSSVIAEIQTKYESEKKENENRLLKQESIIKDQHLINERYSKYPLYAGLILSILIGVSVYTRLRTTRKKNLLIEKQKEDIEHQKLELEEVNKEVMDSINYAKKIQDSMLKEMEHENNHLPVHFVYYKPKHVVSGDFYWFAEKKGHLYIAVADCTGHGVPGAMLSMLGISCLNEIHNKPKLLTCAEILDQLKVKIVNELSQEGNVERMSDGMDISLIRMNLDTGAINWAGANNPLFIVENEIITELNSDRQPIGFTENVIPFTNHEVEPSKDAVYYLFSDGYVDQFGGVRGKKLKQKGFKEKLKEYSNLSLADQSEHFDLFFNEWKGEIDQLDDVTMIGVQSPLTLKPEFNKEIILN